MTYFNSIRASDSPSIDAFSRWRTSNPQTIFESRFRFDLAPLQYEAITSSGTVTHFPTDSYAGLATTAGGAGQLAALQSYAWPRYQPGKGQMALITFVMGAAAANVTRRVGQFNATTSGAVSTPINGIYLEQTGASTVNFVRINAGTQADSTVAQVSWNIDTFNGSGPSGVTLDLSKAQILVIDYQWLGVGRVRVGFDVAGKIFYAHEFLHANIVTDVYMQSATLPIRFELVTAASVASAMKCICAAVISEGGEDDISGYQFVQEFTATAGNNTRVHLGSIRPFLTFNSIQTRYPLQISKIETVVTGNTSVLFELVYGATFSAGPTWAAAAYSTYSGMEVTTAGGTIATSPIIANAWYNTAAATSKNAATHSITDKYILSLNAAGANHAFGTASIYATGLGATSACRVLIAWKEIR